MRVSFILVLLAAFLLLTSACATAQSAPENPPPAPKPEKPDEAPKAEPPAAPEKPGPEEPEEPGTKPAEEKKPPVEKPATPEEPKDEITDDMKRGVIPDGGAATVEEVLSALAAAAEKKDADAIWKLLASETRSIITIEIANMKLNAFSGAEKEKADFLGRKTTVGEVRALAFPKILLRASEVPDYENSGLALWYRYTFSIVGVLEDLDNMERLAETMEKDGRRTDFYVRRPGGVDVHLWFVKEGGRWFFHSPRGGTPPEADREIPVTVAPEKVEVDISTPVSAFRTYALASSAADREALMKCIPEEELESHREDELKLCGWIKAVAEVIPPDQEHVFSSYFGLTWKEINSLPAGEIMRNVRLTEDKVFKAGLMARPLVEAELIELENDGKNAVVEAKFPEAMELLPIEFEFVKEPDGWKIIMPGPPKPEEEEEKK
ncbi:MAG: hypothetical protein ACYS8W_06435 [Planctomycetota bacterium]|jgi:hypothetical protein